MVKYCSAFGCKKNALTPGISFFQFPKDPILRKQWVIKTKRANFNPSSSAVLCRDHFVEEDLEPSTCPSFFRTLSVSEEKIKSVKPRLRPGTVPSRFVFNLPNNLSTCSGLDKSSKPTKTRGAVQKREHLRVLSQINFSGTPESSQPTVGTNSDVLETKMVLSEIAYVAGTPDSSQPTASPNTNMSSKEDGKDNQNTASALLPSVLKVEEMQTCAQEDFIIPMEIILLQETSKKQCQRSEITNIDIPAVKHFKSVSTQATLFDFVPQESSTSTPKKEENSNKF